MMIEKLNFSGYSIVVSGIPGQDINKMRVLLIKGGLTIGSKLKASLTCFAELARENNSLRPSRFWIEDKERRYFQPKEFIRLLRECIQVCIPRNSTQPFLKNLTSFLRTFQVSPKKVSECDLCDFCLVDGYVTIVDQNSKYTLQGSTLCRDCATSEVLKEIESGGDQKVTKATRKQVGQILNTVKRVDKAIRFAFYKKDLISHPELTLFDRIPAEPSRPTMPLNKVDVPPEVRNVLLSEGVNFLLPVQELAIKAGLLKGANLLIVSATSSGKTLIGELAGVVRALGGEKIVYLAPLVALANQKYEEFRARYSRIGLRTAIKVGMSRIDVGDDELVVIDGDVKAANIVSATYEGLDVMLRSGRGAEIGQVGVVIIDEIQMIGDEERGPELDGLITRFKKLFPGCQLICLSATVGNPEELAEELKLSPVIFPGRPVPLERHLIVCFSEGDKLQALVQLVRNEKRVMSTTGFHGQTIVFTNARRRTHQLSAFLEDNGLKATPYHAGMTYKMRKSIELAFVKGAYDAVVTTYALGAGFNAPASQVVFESPSMGNRYLTNSEFEQMMGRAGRLGMHDRGKIVVLAEQGRVCHGEKEETEDKIALELLEGEPEEVEPEHDEDQCSAQLLSDISTFDLTGITVRELEEMYNLMLGRTAPFAQILEELVEGGFAEIKDDKDEKNEMCFTTSLGKATAVSFFTPNETLLVKENAEKLDPLAISLKLNPLRQVYISSSLQSELERAFNTRFSSNLFSGAVLDVMSVSKGGGHKLLPGWVLDMLVKWATEFFNCNCKENPFCDCGAEKICRRIVAMRLTGLTPKEIAEELQEDYGFQIYPGDLFDWFEQEIHRLGGMEIIMKVLGKTQLAEKCKDLAEQIESPHRKPANS
jgi:helicase